MHCEGVCFAGYLEESVFMHVPRQVPQLLILGRAGCGLKVTSEPDVYQIHARVNAR